jgi:hypothetical protein
LYVQGTCDEPLARASYAVYSNCRAEFGGYPFNRAMSIAYSTALFLTNGMENEGFYWGGSNPGQFGGLGGGPYTMATGDISAGVFIHEAGHAWGLPHSVDDPDYPYKQNGNISTIAQFDQLKRRIIPWWRTSPTFGIYDFKFDPMAGGGVMEDKGDYFAAFSDYNFKQIWKGRMSTRLRWDIFSSSFLSNPTFSRYDPAQNAFVPSADVSPVIERFVPVYFIIGVVSLFAVVVPCPVFVYDSVYV